MSLNASEPTGGQGDSTPGKIRTWWHPLLVSVLRWQLGNHYHIEEGVPIGQKPLQIDILLLHKEKGELSSHARDMLAGHVEHLGEFTLIEFKSPSDTLRVGDSQFRLAGKEFAMQHLGADKEMHETLKEIIKRLPLEDRLDFISMDEFPAEERLKGLPAEERLKGLPAEERLKGLSPEELNRLWKMLQQSGKAQADKGD